MTAKGRLQTGTTTNGTIASASCRSHWSPAEPEIGPIRTSEDSADQVAGLHRWGRQSEFPV